MRNRAIRTGIQGGMFNWNMPGEGDERANCAGAMEPSVSTEFIGTFARRENVYIGSVLLYTGDIDDVEDFLRSLSFQLYTDGWIFNRQAPEFSFFVHLRQSTGFELAGATFIYEEAF